MPAQSRAQQRAAGADLSRVRSGQRPLIFRGMSEAELEKLAATRHPGLPERKGKKMAYHALVGPGATTTNRIPEPLRKKVGATKTRRAKKPKPPRKMRGRKRKGAIF